MYRCILSGLIKVYLVVFQQGQKIVMENGTNLPFKVGDMAEARTFEEGFRGAWFRCQVL